MPGMVQTFRFKPSRYLAALLIMVHLVAMISLFPLVLPVWAKAMLVLLLAANLAYLLARDYLLGMPSSCIALAVGKPGVEIHTRSGELMPGRVVQGSLVTPAITVVNVLPQGAHFARSAVILPDGLDTESFRQLRVWLKWSA